MLRLELLIKNEECKKYYFPDSFYNTKEDSGFDIFFPEDVVVNAKSTKLVDTGCVFVLKNNSERRPFYIYPRSSIHKSPLRLSNSVGIIDKGYNGNIKIPIDNTSDKDFTIEAGTRYFQICSGDLSPINAMTFISESELIETERADGGFGSTGTKEVTTPWWQD